jgi:hypothetical protein
MNILLSSIFRVIFTHNFLEEPRSILKHLRFFSFSLLTPNLAQFV